MRFRLYFSNTIIGRKEKNHYFCTIKMTTPMAKLLLPWLIAALFLTAHAQDRDENWKSYPIKDYIDAMAAVFSCNPDNVESSEGSYCFQLENLKWVFSTLPGTSLTVIPKNPLVRLNSCINPSSPLETIEMIAEIESLCPQFKEYYADLMKKRANRKAGARKSSSGVLSEDAISHYLKYKRKPRHATAPLAIITNELLNRKFQEYNDAYFDGRLP